MTQAVVEFFNLRDANATGAVLNKPFAESIVKSPVLAAGDLTGALNGRFVGAKSDVFHIGLFIFRSVRKRRPQVFVGIKCNRLSHETSVHDARVIAQDGIAGDIGVPSSWSDSWILSLSKVLYLLRQVVEIQEQQI